MCRTYVDLLGHKPKMTSGPTTGTTPPPWPGLATPPRMRMPPPISMSSSPPPPGSSSTDNTSWCPLFRPAPSQQLRGRQANLQKISCCWPNKSWPHIICSYLLSSNLSICYSEIGFLIHISQCFLFNFSMTDMVASRSWSRNMDCVEI